MDGSGERKRSGAEEGSNVVPSLPLPTVRREPKRPNSAPTETFTTHHPRSAAQEGFEHSRITSTRMVQVMAGFWKQESAFLLLAGTVWTHFVPGKRGCDSFSGPAVALRVRPPEGRFHHGLVARAPRRGPTQRCRTGGAFVTWNQSLPR